MDTSPQSTTSSLAYPSSSAYTMSVADDVKSQHRQLFNPVTPDISPPPQLAKGGSTMKSTVPQDIMDSSNITSVDIQEMEQVREHLHLMLQNCRGFSDQTMDYDHAHSSTADYETQENDGDVESVATVETTALLQRLLPNSSPLSELQVHFQTGEHGVVSHDQSSRKQAAQFPASSAGKPKAIPSSKVTGDRTLMTENSILRDHLEKERFRRKHCEQQIQELHGKLLETQQQLAVAVSAERKKDAMIEQLDKTLAKVVDGWKKHETEKLAIIAQLKEERGTAELSHQHQQEMLLQFEKELAQAVEALTKEQEKATSAEHEKQTQLQQQKEERSKLLELLAKEKEKVSQLEDGRNQTILELEQLQQKNTQTDLSLEEQIKISEELRTKLASLEEQHKKALAKEKEKLEHEKQTVQDGQAVLMSVQKEVQHLEMELDTAKREKESLRIELHLMEAKHEASRTKEETERHAELEREMTKRLEEIHDQMSKAETEMRESHREQIQGMNRKHKEDLEQQLAKFHEELKRKDVKLKSMSEEYDERISDFQEKMASLENTRQHAENDRQNLSVRLQQMMQSHCEEAIKLLNSSTTKLSPLSGTKQLGSDHGSFLNGKWDSSLKWANEDTVHQDKAPISAKRYMHPTLQQQQRHQYDSKPTSTVFPSHKPQSHNTTHNSISTDSGMLSGSYLFTNGHSGKHGFLSHDQSNLEFHPLHAVVDNDRSIINGQHVLQEALTWASSSGSTGTEHSPKIITTTGSLTGEGETNLLEQDLDVLDQESSSLFSALTGEQNEETLRQTSPVMSNDISQRLQQQESRQAELNHYVKMLLQRSPGDPSYEEQEHLSQGLRLIPSSTELRDGYSSSGVISPIQSEHQLDQQHMTALQYPHQEPKDKHKGPSSSQVAFTKTTVPSTSFSVMSHGFDQRGPPVTQAPYSRVSQVAPHTPPRREKDTEEKSPSPGVLTPQQVGQLSRLLGLLAEPGKPPLTAEQLFAYLRGVKNSHLIEGVNVWSQQQQKPAIPKSSAPVPPQSSQQQQHMGANRTKRSLDANFQKRQEQTPQSQGPSVSGYPINAPLGQVSKPAEQQLQSKTHNKPPPAKHGCGMVGPPLRYHTMQDGTKSAPARTGLQHKEKKNAPAGKQAKSTAWR